MKTKHNFNLMALLMLFPIALLSSCSGSQATPQDEDGGSGITSNDEAIQNIPSPDPSSMDYSLAQEEANVSARSAARQQADFTQQTGCLMDSLYTIGTQAARRLERIFLCKARGAFALAGQGDIDLTLEDNSEVYLHFGSIAATGDEDEVDEEADDEFGREDMVAKITHAEGEGLGTYNLYLCSNNVQIGYASYEVTESAYSGRAVLRRNDSECVDAVYSRNISSITSSDFEGNVSLSFDDAEGQGVLILAADGATQSNTLQGRNEIGGGPTGMALGYWEETQGCGVASFGDQTTGEIAFSISVADDGTKTYSDFSGDSEALCDNLPPQPDAVSCPQFSEISGAAWDCDTTGQTVVEIEEASQLEDVGGDRCRELADAFENAEPDPDACFE